MPGILIIKLGALGDILIAAPLVRRIVDCHAGESICVLTSDEYRDIFAGWPGISVQSFPRRGAGAMVRALRWIRRGRFRRIFDLQSNDHSALLCAFSGVRERVGNHPRFPYSHHPAAPWTGAGHIFDRWREVLSSAGIEPGPVEAWLPISAAEHSQAQLWVREHGLTPRAFAILHAGTSPAHPEKRWPHFSTAATEIRAAGVEVVWAGGRGDRELNLALSRHGGIDASAAFSLTGLAALGTLARFAITNDSAPMHALACAGIPVFGLFGPTNWHRNHAIGQAGNVIAAGADAAEFQPAALLDLPVSVVLARLRSAGVLG
jgi:ADP-heptose:LPS heptosyltransferase